MATVFVVLILLCSDDAALCTAGRSPRTYDFQELCEMDKAHIVRSYLIGGRPEGQTLWAGCVPLPVAKP